jgi:hypothetical protein
MSTVYQLAEDVKQYAEIESISSGGGGANSMKIKAQKENALHSISEEANSMKKFMIIVDHDRINNPMIKSQEG